MPQSISTNRRPRTVYDPSMVAHIWAHQTQDHARNQRENFYFRGATIYSYGGHFPIAQHVTRGKGKRERRAVLFTTRRYSNTTARHIGEVRRAISHFPAVFDVPVIGERPADVSRNWRSYLDRIKAKESEARRSRKYGELLTRDLRDLIREANAYADFYGLRVARIPDDVEAVAAEVSARLAYLSEAEKRAERKAEKARKAREAEARAKAAERLEAWVRGEGSRYSGVGGYGLPTRLRLSADGENIETSMGAEFPADHARRAWPVLRRIRERGAEWHRNGQQIRLGHFGIDHIGEDGTVTAGCHTVEWSEVERMARVLGLEV